MASRGHQGHRPANNFWASVTFGNGLFVAVSYDEGVSGYQVMTSSDGITWTLRVSAADRLWNRVTFGNGLFVAISTNNGAGGNSTGSQQVMTSRDGFAWTLRSTPGMAWLSVTFGNGQFVAVGGGSNGSNESGVMTSPDGINWTLLTTPGFNSWKAVTFANGLFVAVAENGTGDRVMTSGTLIPNVPAAPGVVAGDASASVTVTDALGAWPATSHTVTASPGGASCTIAAASGSCVVSGLTNGTAYTFTTTASNAGGTSAASARSATVTPMPSNVFTATKATAKLTGASIVLTTRVKVPGAGRIFQVATTKQGAQVTTRCKAVKKASRAATYTLTCKLGRAGRAALRRAKMTLTVTTTFTPTGGVKAANKQTVQLARKR